LAALGALVQTEVGLTGGLATPMGAAPVRDPMSDNSNLGDAFVRDLLCSHPSDPANARYWVPLENSEQEEVARAMAAAAYSDRADYFTESITNKQADRVWAQCLSMPAGCCVMNNTRAFFYPKMRSLLAQPQTNAPLQRKVWRLLAQIEGP
jgi:hypothetical protein